MKSKRAAHDRPSIYLVTEEADILLELAKLRRAHGNYAESLRLAEEALSITRAVASSCKVRM